ncbi:AAA family ATPase [Verrucosispora sp. FIM060022]|uniref:AAA family ATPase n=1 Tax=Verrucosispora sp. FIM060022 TaxID=1479020 RepID=UPI000F8850AE|nr:AAA family ATPase [Verrucosispora sp. FIM060022]RUL90336.1 ATP-binding protein [Verrucosispora sp. FIM060022]
MTTSKVALRGGGASKVSGIYEDHWTIYMLIDLLIGLAESITLEPPGTAGVGFEFFVDRAGVREWHQVKYQNSLLGKWTLAALQGEDVLENFRSKLAGDKRSTCVFVSAHAAHPLGKLCDHATESTSLAYFIAHFLSSKELTDAFSDLQRKHWNVTDQEAWTWLRSRIKTRTLDAWTLEERLRERAGAFLDGDPKDAVAALLGVVRGALYRALDRDELIRRLAEEGTTLRGMGASANEVHAATERFRTGVEESLVNASFLAREEVPRIARCLRSSQSTLVTGGKGCGKSAVLAGVVRELLLSNVEVLTIDVTRLVRETSSAEVGRTLGLATPPAAALAAVARNKPAVLAIDSLDSVGVNRDKPVELFRAVSEVMREAAAYPNMAVLVSCRTEDLDTDTRLRSLVREPDPAAQFDVAPLSREQAAGALVTAGHDLSKFDEDQITILRNPGNLRILTKVPPGELFDFTTEQELVDGYLDWAVRT